MLKNFLIWKYYSETFILKVKLLRNIYKSYTPVQKKIYRWSPIARGVTVAIISWGPWEIDKSALRTYLILLWSHVDEWVREEINLKVRLRSVW